MVIYDCVEFLGMENNSHACRANKTCCQTALRKIRLTADKLPASKDVPFAYTVN